MKRDEPSDDAAWQAIVENYGEPVLGDEDVGPAAGAARAADPAPAISHERDDETDPFLPDPFPDDDEDAFVPPAPPPLPRPTPDRLAAWLGIFLAPALLLALVVTGYHPPRPVAWLLVAWFVGGFLYLVAKMPGSRPDPWDDGAQL